jgi:hypothetical protein
MKQVDSHESDCRQPLSAEHHNDPHDHAGADHKGSHGLIRHVSDSALPSSGASAQNKVTGALHSATHDLTSPMSAPYTRAPSRIFSQKSVAATPDVHTRAETELVRRVVDAAVLNNLHLSVWDLAGQTLYHELAHLLLSE